MKRILIPLMVLIGLWTITLVALASSNVAPAPPTPTPSPEESEKEEVELAVLEAFIAQREYVLGFLVYDLGIENVVFAEDRTWSIASLTLVDPQSGQVVPAEPGLAIIRRQGAKWKATLPADPGWLELIKSAPIDLLSEEQKSYYIEINAKAEPTAAIAFGGYLLPWEAGKTVYLSQSTGHDQYIPSGSAHYAFDFYIPQTMYNLYASKAGTVWRAKWDVPNNSETVPGNYLVLMDTSTSPTTYQLYLHLAQDSIPPGLRVQGTYVAQGQFLGIADDTGQSTGHHLHFQVHTNPDSYWGTSIDITFDDVDINGGRPRINSDKPYCTRPSDVCNQFRSAYVSGNIIHGDTSPPTGDLFEPLTGVTVSAPTVFIEGWASDEGSGLDRVRLIAYFENAWHEIGNEFTTNIFSMNWEMCSENVPDGPVSLALKIWDQQGNPALGLPGLSHFTKDYSCAPPPLACIPGDNQVALFTETDYFGDCLVFGIGNYPDSSFLGKIGNNNIDSILVGSNVLATLYLNDNYAGRGDTFDQNDSSLNDNLVQNDQVSSFKVSARNQSPSAPTTLVAPLNEAIFPGGSSLSLVWLDPGGSTQFQTQLQPPGSVNPVYSPWLADPLWQLDAITLVPGTYTWKARARNCPDISCRSPWSVTQTFTVTTPPTPPATIVAPFFDNAEINSSNWNSSGLWNRLNDSAYAHGGNYSWYYGKATERNYDDGTPNTGDLTLRPITIPDASFVLRFWYRYQTETPGTHWDQRWLQISLNNGPYENVLQLSDDVANEWLQATINLASFAGNTIRVRFHFESNDSTLNAFEGWHLDDFEITAAALPACSDTNNSPSTATPLDFGQIKSGVICPSGDIDYFKFTGTAGERIVVDIDTPNTGRPDGLDLIIFLMDSDGSSVLAVHDDEIYAERLDPHLGYLLTRSGTYYIKAHLWSHPSVGGENYTYSINLSIDNAPPVVEFTNPQTGASLQGNEPITLSVQASDSGSGISHVQFLLHSEDWFNSTWQQLALDQKGEDGWNLAFDPTSLKEGNDVAFYANVYDWAGNWVGTGAWNLTIDRTPPVSALTALAGIQESTAISLQWSSSDNLSGLDHLEMQFREGTGAWVDIAPDPAGSTHQLWFVGEAEMDYGFRMRAVDLAGNKETFPSSAETETTIPDIATLCSTPDTWDSGRNDNTPSTASTIAVGAMAKTHNFCNPMTSDRLNDEDWVKFTVQKNKLYLIQSLPQAPMTASVLELYAANGTTLITSFRPTEFGQASLFSWTSDRNGQIYLRLRHVDGRVAGNIAAYKMSVNLVSPIFLPLVNK